MVTFSIVVSIVCSFSPGTNTEVSYGSKERERGDSRNPIKGKQKDTGSPGRSPPSPALSLPAESEATEQRDLEMF